MGEAPIAPHVWEELRRPAAYPDDPGASDGVEEIQTHISRVFLTRDRVYKFRKAAVLPFVDFGARGERNADCEREVALNRRLAPDVYLGVAPLLLGPGGARVGPLTSGTASDREHCVVMRRLPEGRDALSRLLAGSLSDDALEATARRIARFHAASRLPPGEPSEAGAWLSQVERPFEDCLTLLRDAPCAGIERAAVDRVRVAAHAALAAAADRFEARRAAGCRVDGHGDLHLAHVWFEKDGEEPIVVDCVEFSEALRHVDAASDVAFLAMDLAYRGHTRSAERFLRVYAGETDDYSLYEVVDYYGAYRAAVRAKVANLAAGDAALPEAQRNAARTSARDHLALAERFLQYRPPGAVVAMCGLVGSGKSTVAEAIADAVDGVVIASDRVRRSRRVEAELRASGLARYDPAAIDLVYEGLLERADAVVRSGRTAILDATYSSRRHRDALRAWARARGAAVALVETRCPRGATLGRLAQRAARGTDASEAGPEQYARSAAEYEPTSEWPRSARVLIDTARDSTERIRELASRLHWEGGP